MKQLELLAPARDYASVVAAVDAGADAIYIGGARFRCAAAAVPVDDAGGVCASLRRAGAPRSITRCFFYDELAAAERQARDSSQPGVDAIITGHGAAAHVAARRTARPTQTAIRTRLPRRRFLSAGLAHVILNGRCRSTRSVRSAARRQPRSSVSSTVRSVCWVQRSVLSRRGGAPSGNRANAKQ